MHADGQNIYIQNFNRDFIKSVLKTYIIHIGTVNCI